MNRICCSLIFGLLLQLAPAQSWLTNGLIAYYPFNGNANDESGHGYHGQLAGSVTLAQDRFGHAGSAYYFGDAYASINVYAPVLNLGQPEYTVAGWFCSSDVTKLYQNIINTIPHPGFMVELNNEVVSNRLMFATGTGSAWTDLYLTGTKTNYSNEVWQQFVFIKQGTNYSIYVNGQVDGQYTVAAAATYNYNVGYRFGAINSGTWNWQGFKGRLDDFRIYNRALTSNEVLQLYSLEFPAVAKIAKACTVDFSNLAVGATYQIQVSSDMNHWTNWGAPFTATDPSHTNSTYERVDDWSQRFFRVQLQ